MPDSSATRTHLKFLGLDRTCRLDQIHAASMELFLLHHPLKLDGLDLSEQEIQRRIEIYSKAVAAFEYLVKEWTGHQRGVWKKPRKPAGHEDYSADDEADEMTDVERECCKRIQTKRKRSGESLGENGSRSATTAENAQHCVLWKLNLRTISEDDGKARTLVGDNLWNNSGPTTRKAGFGIKAPVCSQYDQREERFSGEGSFGR